MSRCFPFPPPGYENKARSDHVDLLAKHRPVVSIEDHQQRQCNSSEDQFPDSLLPMEKHKEKKHKKEKRDKEKREGKEKKDKDRSKDKHREKKDRKEKHKDKRRDKDRDKDKHRTSDDSKFEGQTEGHNGGEKPGDSSRKAEEVKDSKFTQELDKRIRDEEKGAAHRMLERFTGSIPRSAEGLGTAIAIEKERSNGNKKVGILVSEEHRRNDGMGRPVEKNADKKIQGKEKAKDKETDDRKGDRHKDRDREEKRNKEKGNHRHKEKEKEKEKPMEKNGHKHEENDRPKESGKKDDEVDSQNFKPLAPHKYNDKCIGADGNNKRKDIEMNGFLHENDVRPNKLPRLAPSSDTHLVNGKILEPFRIATPHSSIGHQAKNNHIKPERALDKKEYKINGTAVARPSSVDSRPSVAVNTRQNGEASLRPPHPDSKYLSRIYTVPKMEDLSESDEQEWLFSSDITPRPKPKAKSEALETPQVWAEVLQIQSEDFSALPYVIPY